MPINIVVPQMSESVVEATVLRWLKHEGDKVSLGESVVELETEKANFEVAAEQAGVLTQIEKKEGADVKVGDTLGVIDEAKGAPAGAPKAEIRPEPSAQKPKEEEETPPVKETKEGNGKDAPKVTPVAQNVARDQGVDVARVQPTGPSGRITKEDVEKYIEKQRTEPAKKEAPKEVSNVEPIRKEPAEIKQPEIVPTISDTSRREERVRMTRRRRTIARRMVEAQSTAAILTTFNEVDMTAVMNLRKKRKESFKERHGIGLGLNSFFVKAAIGALKVFPFINAEIEGDDAIIVKHYYDIGIAIGAAEGLIVPVIKDADRLGFAEIEKKIKDFAERSESNSLTLEELRGGTFTITNGGVFGSLMSTPILNPPQVGILGLHKIEERPMAINGQVVIRPMMYVALSYDHRIVDGREAVQFLVKVKELIEDPETLLLEG